LGLEEMGQGVVIIAGGLKGNPARATAVGEKSRELCGIFQSFGDAEMAATGLVICSTLRHSVFSVQGTIPTR
jgi:hypothetical protein